MRSALAMGASSFVLLLMNGCSDDRSAGARVGTENTVKLSCLVDGRPMADVRVLAFRHGGLPEFLGGEPPMADAFSDSQGNVSLLFPSDVRYVDLQVRSSMRGANVRRLDVTRGETFAPVMQPGGVLAWRSGSDNPCPARRCGIWFEGTSYGNWSGDSLSLWTDAPNGTYWPVVWFHDSTGLRLVRFDSVELKFTTAYRFFSDEVPSYRALYEGLGQWDSGCRVALPVRVDSLTGAPLCR